MKKIIYNLLIMVVLVAGAFYVDNSKVAFAEKGDVLPLSIQFNVYTDVGDTEEDFAKGGYTTVYGNTFVKADEEWIGTQTILNKVKPLVDNAMKTKTGKNYSTVSLIKASDPDRRLYAAPLDKNSSIDGINDYTDIRIWFIDRDGYENGDNYKLLINVFASENGPLNGWHLHGGAERYYTNNVFKTGLSKVGKTTYLFNKYGAKQYGWNVVEGWSMYFNEDNGGLWTGKRKIGQTTYLFDSQGHKIDGWHRLNGKDYYFNEENGGMWTGKRTIGRTTYLLHNNGYKITGWYVDDYGSKYYFDPNFGGGMVTSLRKVGNAYYYFDTEDGSALVNDSKEIDGKTWYFNSSGIGKVIK